MRDVGVLVWVVLVIVGVVSSIISTVRKGVAVAPSGAAPRAASPRAVSRWTTAGPRPVLSSAAPPQPPPRLAPPPPRRAPPPGQLLAATHAAELPRGRRPLFVGKNELVRAVVAAEILGKPRALRDEHLSG